MSSFAKDSANPMGHSRVQQVLREARAMIGTVRPQTPTVPPGIRLGALGPKGPSSFSSGRDGLGSPTGTPTPEMEMLVNTDREVKGIVARATAVGQQWAQALLSMEPKVRHRAAANIFRHCQDELLDTALAAVTRTTPTINVQLLKSEGALAALLVAARQPYAVEATDKAPTVISPFERVTRMTLIIAAAAETPGQQASLVTNGAIQTIAELLPRLLESSQAAPTATAVVAVRPLSAILNLLTALRRLCEEYPHHILKVGLVDSLVKAFGIVLTLISTSSMSAALETSRPATAVGAFASRFAFASTVGAASASAGAPAGTASTIASTVVRILCQLSFDEDCLEDLRLRKDNLTEPLLKLLESTDPLQEPLLCSRLLLLVSRLIDGRPEACEDMVSFHWDTVVGKAFECIQKRKDIRLAVQQSVRPPSQPANGEAPPGQPLSRTHSSSSIPPEDEAKPTSDAAYIDAVASDAVIAALALLSNVTLVEEGGYSLATSMPHMQCLMTLVNSDDPSVEGSGHLTATRYGLVCLCNLSYYLPMMEEGDEDRAALVSALCLSVTGFLFEGDVEATLEATRLLGNMSRTAEGRRWMEDYEAGDALVLFLGHEDSRLVYNCLGILLNLTADEAQCPSVCNNPEAVSLLLSHTQRLVSGNFSWEIKELVQMLLKNIRRLDAEYNGAEVEDAIEEEEGPETPRDSFGVERSKSRESSNA